MPLTRQLVGVGWTKSSGYKATAAVEFAIVLVPMLLVVALGIDGGLAVAAKV
jgi:Flp pilus assembly protein TadG